MMIAFFRANELYPPDRARMRNKSVVEMKFNQIMIVYGQPLRRRKAGSVQTYIEKVARSREYGFCLNMQMLKAYPLVSSSLRLCIHHVPP